MKPGTPLWRDELRAQTKCEWCFLGGTPGCASAVLRPSESGLSSLGFPAFVSQSLKYTQILILFTEELMCGTVACPDDCSHPGDFLADSL